MVFFTELPESALPTLGAWLSALTEPEDLIGAANPPDDGFVKLVLNEPDDFTGAEKLLCETEPEEKLEWKLPDEVRAPLLNPPDAANVVNGKSKMTRANAASVFFILLSGYEKAVRG